MSLIEVYDLALNGDWSLKTILPLIPLIFMGQIARLFGLFVLPYFVLFQWFKGLFASYKIQAREISNKLAWHQFKYNFLMSTINVFAAIGILSLGRLGVFKLYTDINEYSLTYFVFTIVFMILIHDFYFYWLHRLFHTPYFFKKFHYIHHKGGDTTPMASFCFHPIEAIANMGIIFLQISIFPVHPYAILSFNIFMMTYNLIGHLGYDFFPRFWTKNPITDFFVTTFHHNQHHSKTRGNYGLYFTFWDRAMNTEFANYHLEFDRLKDAQEKDEIICEEL